MSEAAQHEATIAALSKIVNGIYRTGLQQRHAPCVDMQAALTAFNERRLELAVRWMVRHSDGAADLFQGLPSVEDATFEFQMPLAARRIADLVVFHRNGSATVVEMKDGSMGFEKTRAAIGQVGLYAYLMGQAKVHASAVRRAVMWTGMSDDDSRAMQSMCIDAGIVPLQVTIDLAEACRRAYAEHMMLAVIGGLKKMAQGQMND